MLMTNLFDLKPVDPNELTMDQLVRVEILESGFIAFWEQATKRSHDSTEQKAKDAFFAGASLIASIMSALIDEGVRDHVSKQISAKLDEEIERFNAVAGYDLKFTPFVRDLK